MQFSPTNGSKDNLSEVCACPVCGGSVVHGGTHWNCSRCFMSGCDACEGDSGQFVDRDGLDVTS
jgi:hypothetical protein